MCRSIVEYSGSPNTEKVRHHAEMSSPQSVRFPLEFVSVVGFSVHWVHTVFHRVLQPCQEKGLVVNKHVLVNASWCLKDANSIGCFGRSSFRSWPVEKDLIPIRLQFVAFYTFLQQSLPLTPSMQAFVDFLLFCLRCASMKI